LYQSNFQRSTETLSIQTNGPISDDLTSVELS